MLILNSGGTGRLVYVPIDLGHKDNLVPVNFVYGEAIQLVDHGHV